MYNYIGPVYIDSENYRKGTRENLPLVRDLGTGCYLHTSFNLNRHNVMTRLNVVWPKNKNSGSRQRLLIGTETKNGIFQMVGSSKNVILLPVSKQVHVAVSHANKKQWYCLWGCGEWQGIF